MSNAKTSKTNANTGAGNPLDLLTLRSSLGKGSYGTVFRAMTTGKEIYAAKVYDPEMMIGDFIGKKYPWHYEDNIFENFFQEVIVYSKIGYNIPHVANIISIGMGYIIFPEYKLGDLSSIPAEDLQSSWKRIFYQICLGVRNLHHNSVVHLDLKPQNILFDEEMVPYICDLGSAAFMPSEDLNFEGIATDRCGTQIHQPPEALISDNSILSEAGLNKLSYHVDIWSLGTILYKLITGKLFVPPPQSLGMDKAGPLILGSASAESLVTGIAGGGTTNMDILASFSEEMHYGEFFEILEQSVHPGCDESILARLTKYNVIGATEEELAKIADLLVEIFHPNPANRPTILEVLDHELFEGLDEKYLGDVPPEPNSVEEYVIPNCSARAKCASYISSMQVYERAKHLAMSIIDRYILAIGPINADNSPKFDVYMWAFSAMQLACMCFSEYFLSAFGKVAEQAVSTNIGDIREMAIKIAKKLNLEIYDVTPYELTQGNYPFSKYADTGYASGYTVRELVDLQ